MAWALLVCILLWISALKVTKKVKHQSLMCLSCPKTSDRTAMVSSVPWNIITLSTRYYIINSVMHAFWLVLTYDLLEYRRIDDVIIKTFFPYILILYYIKQIDSKLPWVFSVIDHRGRQNGGGGGGGCGWFEVRNGVGQKWISIPWTNGYQL